MQREIRKVAVLGSGVMGGGIAAHLANAGIPCLLLDILPRDLKPEEQNSPAARNRIAAAGLQAALKAKPAAFMDAKDGELVTVGNFDDDLPKIKDVDWVIEVVVENPKVKQSVFEKVEQYAGVHTIISSNTSGIPISVMTEGRSESFKKRFLVTHFFNPVRYMKLLELVAGPETDKEILKTVADFGTYKLGKGIVWGKDTPNFVANRIGVHSMMATIHYMANNGYTIPEVDAIVGEPLGRPGTAAFKTADLVGLDTFVHVANNCFDSLTQDEDRDVFRVPEFIKAMVEKKLLGDKTKAGFYRKDGNNRFVIDPTTLEYLPLGDKVKFDAVKKAKNQETPAGKVKVMAYAEDRAGKLVWDLMKQTLPYAARRVGEISDTIVDIDNGMKWGFNWAIGPFETWDAIGVRQSVEKMKAEGTAVPANVEEFLAGGNETFYKKDGDSLLYYCFKHKSYHPVPKAKEEMDLFTIRAHKTNVIKRNGGAWLQDIGDGVLNLEFDTKMNAIDGDIIEMIDFAVKTVEEGDWKGLTITNQGEHFSVGANLMLIWMGAQQGEWEQIRTMLNQFQQANMRLKYCRKPTVVAPFGYTFGGGCEVVLHGQQVVAAGETYIGLVEVGAGVIPAGGGTKEMIIRNLAATQSGVEVDPFPFIRKTFETIGTAKVATSAKEARNLGFLKGFDQVVLNKSHLLYRAKQAVLGLSQMGYQAPRPVTDIRLPGPDGAATLKLGLFTMMQGGYISEHDYKVGSQLARILTGGDTNINKGLTEQDLLDLECESFLSLCGEEKSQKRMESLLMTGKPLRN